jgi:hypothetical protein
LIGMIFVIALALTGVHTFRRGPVFDARGVRMAMAITIALIILPLVFVTFGFVASSTLLFAIAAAALRGERPSIRSCVVDLAIGAAFSIALFVTFTRGLGVSLPGPSFF